MTYTCLAGFVCIAQPPPCEDEDDDDKRSPGFVYLRVEGGRRWMMHADNAHRGEGEWDDKMDGGKKAGGYIFERMVCAMMGAGVGTFV